MLPLGFCWSASIYGSCRRHDKLFLMHSGPRSWLVLDILGISVAISRSSAFDPWLRAQARVIAAAKAAGATHYLNSPGGHSLYDSQAFAKEGIELNFLPPYDGSHVYLLPALLTQP